MTTRTPTPSPLAPHGSTQRYRDRIYDDPRHDPYQTKGKLTEPVVCATCHAVYHHGHWAWGAAPAGARAAECPACHRIRDRQPAGYVTLSGDLTETDRDALLRLIRNVEQHEKAEHPLHRIIAIEERANEVRITTTDTHLPQRIGEALRSAQNGELEIAYGRDEYAVRVNWRK